MLQKTVPRLGACLTKFWDLNSQATVSKGLMGLTATRLC